MLTTLLSSLQSTSFLSKGFWLGSMLPVVVLAGSSLAMCSIYFPQSSPFISRLDTLPSQGMILSGIAISLIAAAYLLSAMSPTLLKFLEGESFPGSVRMILHSRQWGRFTRLQDELIDALCEVDAFLEQIDDHQSGWEAVLSRADEKGRRQAATAVKRLSPFSLKANFIVRLRLRFGLKIKSALIQHAVEELVPFLEASPFTPVMSMADQRAVVKLNAYSSKLRRAIWAGRNRWLKEKDELFNTMQAAYPATTLNPSLATTLNVLAPTSFGNIGATSRRYALDTYGLDLNIFWNRLQKIIQTDKFYDTLQDAKIQVDALVAMFWLTWLFIFVWGGILTFRVPSPSGFAKLRQRRAGGCYCNLLDCM